MNPEIDSFLSRRKGYLFLTIEKTRVVILREDIGVSYYYLYPISDIADAMRVNDFMHYAIPFLNKKLSDGDSGYLYNPQPPINL